jgi:peptide-methionine (R)-S-oxide reductase
MSDMAKASRFEAPSIDRRLFLLGAAALAACGDPAISATDRYAQSPWRTLSAAEWKKRLSPQAFAILREEATERSFTSPLDKEHRRGTFLCLGCDLPLFKSQWKFDSGTGWPSFYRAIPGAVATKIDRSLVIPRTEYHCAQCLGHHGHLFEDGPQPTGLRYCNNGAALHFVAS